MLKTFKMPENKQLSEKQRAYKLKVLEKAIKKREKKIKKLEKEKEELIIKRERLKRHFPPIRQLFRITQAKIYEKNIRGETYRLGQIRVWVITGNPQRYGSKGLLSLVDMLQRRFNVFRRAS